MLSHGSSRYINYWIALYHSNFDKEFVLNDIN